MDTIQDRVDREMALVDIANATQILRDARDRAAEAQRMVDEAQESLDRVTAYARKIGALR